MPSPDQPDSPEAQPQRPRPRSRRGGSRLYSPGSDATTRRLVTASERRARRERQQSGDDGTTTPAPSELAKPAEPAAAAEPADAIEPAAASAAVKRSTTTKSREAAKTDEDSETAGNATGKTVKVPAKERAEERRKVREIREHYRSPVLPVALGIATLVLGGLAAWFGAEAHSLTSTPAARNTALTDVAATSNVRNQIGSAVAELFSYDYARPGPTTRAANLLLTGPAVRQYANLFAQVHKNAPGQKLIVTTTISYVGVEMLTGDQARLLVFATETDTHTAGGQPASAAAMLAVNAVRQGSTWKIEGIDTY